MDNQAQQPVGQVVSSEQFAPYNAEVAPKHSRAIEYGALGSVIILFMAMFMGASILVRPLLILFGLFAAAYITLDYLKNRKIAQSVQNQPAGQAPGYQVTPSQQVVYIVQQKPPKSTAAKAVKFALVTGAVAVVVIFVFPFIAIFLLIIVMGSSGQSS